MTTKTPSFDVMKRRNVSSEYAFGNKAEIELEELICERFDVKRDLYKYALFDYKGENSLVELKNRRCKSNSFIDIMMNANKIEGANKTEKDVYFVFQFTDGVYYWKYDKNIELRTDINGRTDRGMNEQKQFYYIPTNLLKKVNENPVII